MAVPIVCASCWCRRATSPQRAAAAEVIAELNRTVAHDRLVLWRWETDARSGLHRDGPQGLIDELMDIASADVVIGVFWKRFGTPTHDAQSGTEHELRRAWAAWQRDGRPEAMVYFSDREYAPRNADEARQWARVLEFKEQLPAEQLWWSYTEPVGFERLLREHLVRYLAAAGVATPGSLSAGREPMAPRVRFNVPLVTAAFTGRDDELKLLDDALVADDRAVITQAIAGLGGVGKSQLAARYTRDRQDGYDVVAWIRAEEGGIVDLAALALKLGLESDGVPPGEQAQQALDWLSACDRPWLLVLDNVESAAQLEGLLPRGGNGRVLVTSRDRGLGQLARVLSIDVFDDDTATRYLVERSGRTGDEVAARRVAQALGGLPLALSHAAAYCRSGESFTAYEGLLEQLPARDLFDHHPERSYAQTVASTWRASITAATADAPLAAEVLDMAAFLAADAIPKTLFEVLVKDAGDARERRRLGRAFNALARYSLATVSDDTISVHRLLQKVIRDVLAEEADPRAARDALRAVDGAFAHDTTTPTLWPRCEELLAHALALADTLPRDADADGELIALLNRATDYLYYSHGGHRAVDACERVAGDAERLLGPEHPHTLEARNNLAGAFEVTGRAGDAIAIHEPLLTDRERILGADHASTLATRNNLACAYQAAGRVDDAIAIYEPLLSDRERILGAEHPDTLMTRHNFAYAYQAAGRVDDAIAIFEPSLTDYERILGAEHPDTLTARNNLACVYEAAGRVGDARRMRRPSAPGTSGTPTGD